jgi:hypothetical protein
MSDPLNTAELRRVRPAVLDGLLTEFEEVNPDLLGSHVPMDVRRRLDEHDIGDAGQAGQSPQPAAHGGAAEACHVGAAGAELLGAVGEGSEVGHGQGRTVSAPSPKREGSPVHPRESGFLEVTVRAEGCLAVATSEQCPVLAWPPVEMSTRDLAPDVEDRK